MDADNSTCEPAASHSLESLLGTKEATWLTDPFMSTFGPLLLPVGVCMAEDLLLLTPEQALQIRWSDSNGPFTVAKKKMHRMLEQIAQEHRLSVVLHRFEENISKLLSIGKGQYHLQMIAGT